MSLSQQLQQSSALTPAEHERRKSAQQRAEDFMYTINHAITCLSLTDFLIAPFFSTVFGWSICGHGHDHSNDGTSSAHHQSGSASATTPEGGYGLSHVHGPWCNHDSPTASSATTTEDFKKAFEQQLNENNKPNLPPPKGIFRSLVQEEPSELMGPPRYEETHEFVGPPKPDHLKNAPIAEPLHYPNGFNYTPPTPPAKPTMGERVAAWWKELRTSPLEYLKKQYPGFKEWAIGEAVGDIGAVPFTLAVQHFAPGVMTGIQRGLEPVIGGIMHRRAEKAARHWADRNGINRDAEEVVNRAQELYHYEMRHLPQMALWTLSSVAINYGVMKFRNPALEIGAFAKGKAAGAAITATLVLGARTLSPEKAHAWDETMGRRVVVPVTKTVGRLFGVDSDTIEKQARHHEHGSWAERVVQEPAKEAALGA